MVREHAGLVMQMFTRNYGNADTGAIRQGSIPEKSAPNQEGQRTGTASVEKAKNSCFWQEKNN